MAKSDSAGHPNEQSACDANPWKRMTPEEYARDYASFPPHRADVYMAVKGDPESAEVAVFILIEPKGSGDGPQNGGKTMSHNDTKIASGSEAGQPVGLEGNTAHSASLSAVKCSMYHCTCFCCHAEWQSCAIRHTVIHPDGRPVVLPPTSREEDWGWWWWKEPEWSPIGSLWEVVMVGAGKFIRAGKTETYHIELAGGTWGGKVPDRPNPSHHDGAAPAPSVDGVVGQS